MADENIRDKIPNEPVGSEMGAADFGDKNISPDGMNRPVRKKADTVGKDGKPVKRKRPVDENGNPIKRKRPVDEDGNPIKRKRPVDENGNPIKRERPVDENGNPIKRKRPVDEDGNPIKRGRPVDENGNPIKRKRPVDENGNPIKRKRPVDENGNPIKRKRPVDENGNPIKRKRPVDENGNPIKRKRPVDENGNPIKRKRPVDENGDPIKRKRPVDENGNPIKRKRQPAGESGSPTDGARPRPVTEQDITRKRIPPEDSPDTYARLRPTGKHRKKHPQGEKTMSGNNNSVNPKKQNNDKKEDSRGCMFPIFLMLICIVIFVVSFTVLVGFMQNHSFNDLVSIAKGEGINEEATEEVSEDSNFIDTDNLLSRESEQLFNTERRGVISQISLGSNTMKIYDIESETSVLLSFNNSTEFTNENDIGITVNKIDEGDLVVFVYDENRVLQSVKLDPDAEEYTSLAVTVNSGRKMIKIGDNAFKYNENTVFRYKDKILSPSDITEFDIMTVKVIDYNAWSVVMERSHGTLKFVNIENIPGVTYSVDEGDFNTIPENREILLPEGLHNIMVQGPSISDYSSQFIIKEGTVSELNLSGVQVLRGSLIIDTYATGAALYVDGVQRDIGNPMFLNYGSHRVTLTRPDNSVTKNIDINKEQTYLSINFE